MHNAFSTSPQLEQVNSSKQMFRIAEKGLSLVVVDPFRLNPPDLEQTNWQTLYGIQSILWNLQE